MSESADSISSLSDSNDSIDSIDKIQWDVVSPKRKLICITENDNVYINDENDDVATHASAMIFEDGTRKQKNSQEAFESKKWRIKVKDIIQDLQTQISDQQEIYNMYAASPENLVKFKGKCEALTAEDAKAFPLHHLENEIASTMKLILSCEERMLDATTQMELLAKAVTEIQKLNLTSEESDESSVNL